MGYVLLLFLCISSLHAMEEQSSGDNLPAKAADLLGKITAANVGGVQECLLQGVKPRSRVVCVGKDSEHCVNDFVTEAMELEDKSKRYAILQLLLDYGVKPDHSVKFGEETPQKMPMLSYVIERFGIKGVLPQEALLLIAHGADVKERDFLGRSPLSHAWSEANIDMLRALRLSGASSMELPEDDPYREEIRLLCTDIEEYKRQYPEACSTIQSQLDELKAEKLSRKRKVDEQFSVDRGIPRSPRKGPRKDERH